MRILVTGDMGNLGSRARTLLEAAGHEVIGFDIQRGEDQNVAGSAHARRALKQAMTACECVLHAAAIPHPRHGGPRQYFEVNVAGTMNVLEAAAETRVRRFVYVSSTGYYGCDIEGTLFPKYLPIDESHPIAAALGQSAGRLEIYNQSKVAAEQLVAYYGSHRIMETIALRVAPANPKSWQYRTGFDPLTDDSWKFGCFFSNCHPDFAAQAMVKALEAKGHFWYEPFNITDLFTHRLVDIYEIAAARWPNVFIRSGLNRQASLITPKRAMTMLGYEPCEDLE